MKTLFLILVLVTNLFSQKCLLWNKLENNTVVQNSIIGNDGVISGSMTYGAVKFGSGALSSANDNYITVTQNISQIAGCVEFWWKANFNPGGSTHYSIWSAQDADVSSKVLFYHNYSYGFGFNFYWSDNSDSIFVPDADAGFTASGDLIHFAIVWDSTGGIEGSKRLAIYVNGVLKVSSSGTFTPGDAFTYHRICRGLDSYGNWYSNSYVDNIKIWNYAKTDFSDRFKEAFRQTGHYQ